MTEGFTELGRYCTDVLEDDAGSFSFMHRIRKGVNRQSHALKVARLAGLPDSAISVARGVLETLEKQSKTQSQQSDTAYEQPLLSAAAG
jgi:DNA mismatch repair ATPase MutS